MTYASLALIPLAVIAGCALAGLIVWFGRTAQPPEDDGIYGDVPRAEWLRESDYE